MNTQMERRGMSAHSFDSNAVQPVSLCQCHARITVTVGELLSSLRLAKTRRQRHGHWPLPRPDLDQCDRLTLSLTLSLSKGWALAWEVGSVYEVYDAVVSIVHQHGTAVLSLRP